MNFRQPKIKKTHIKLQPLLYNKFVKLQPARFGNQRRMIYDAHYLPI